MGLFDRAVSTLRYLRDKIDDVEDWIFRQDQRKEWEIADVINEIRRVPADDMAKKRTLARFFAGPSGQRFSTEERRAAYDELLGRDRNRRTFG